MSRLHAQRLRKAARTIGVRFASVRNFFAVGRSEFSGNDAPAPSHYELRRDQMICQPCLALSFRRERKLARPAGLDHRFAKQREARGDLETAAASPNSRSELARPAGLEPAAPGLEGPSSNRLSMAIIRSKGDLAPESLSYRRNFAKVSAFSIPQGDNRSKGQDLTSAMRA